MEKSLGFIGGGRITQIFLAALKRKNSLPASIVVNEIDDIVINQIHIKFPSVKVEKEINDAVKQEYIFISLHPPVFKQTLERVNGRINEKSIIISLAPKLTCNSVSKALSGFDKIVRMIPNAPSIINEGYNPVYFSQSIDQEDKEELKGFLSVFGDTPEVDERKLEAYAILTAMGPTYFWFQLYELKKLSEEFGLSLHEIKEGLKKMMTGSLNTMFSGMDCNEVIDLIPVRPLGEYESIIVDYYKNSLRNIFNKIKVV